MTRQLVSSCLGACLVTLLPALNARAVEMPLRKAGLWEMKLTRPSSQLPSLTMQHCTDATTDKEMASAFSPMAKDICSRSDIQQTATGYVTDSMCSVAGASITSHSEVTGDFDSAYTVITTSHSERPVGGMPPDSSTTVEAKWLGACKPDQKPGDIMMPGGFRLNIKDAEKFKGSAPK